MEKVIRDEPIQAGDAFPQTAIPAAFKKKPYYVMSHIVMTPSSEV